MKIIHYIFAAGADDKVKETKVQKREMEKKEEKEEKETCSICLAEIITGQDEKLMLCCFNSFHNNCLERWTQVKKTCPMCRAVIYESDLMYIIR